MFLVLLLLYLRVCFFTLTERKLLGYVQNRKGPTKIIIIGIIQPVVDGGKLLFKILSLNFIIFLNSLIFIIIMGMIRFLLFFDFRVILGSFFTYTPMVSIIIVYLVFLLGWESESIYGIIGGLRRSSQMIAYDVILFFMIALFLLNFFGYGFKLNFRVFYL